MYSVIGVPPVLGPACQVRPIWYAVVNELTPERLIGASGVIIIIAPLPPAEVPDDPMILNDYTLA
jgi:hypothetical protein